MALTLDRYRESNLDSIDGAIQYEYIVNFISRYLPPKGYTFTDATCQYIIRYKVVLAGLHASSMVAK